MQSSITRRLLLAAVFVAMSSSPRQASADLSLTIDNPNQEITLPLTGSLQVDFTGIVSGGTPLVSEVVLSAELDSTNSDDAIDRKSVV